MRLPPRIELLLMLRALWIKALVRPLVDLCMEKGLLDR